MAKCWAQEIGPCSDKQSREHLVSRGLFLSAAVDVQGMPWCRDSPKRVGLDSVTRKILCSHHNNSLSPLDQAAIDAFDAFRDQVKASHEAPPGILPTTFRRAVIDALRLERWLLKTLINVSFEGDLLIGPGGNERGVPARMLVQIVYGQREFPGRSGMYVATAPGQVLQSTDTVEFAPLIKEKHRIVGALFTFRGVNLVLVLEPAGPDPDGFARSPGVGERWRSLSLLRRLRRIDYAPVPSFIAHEIVFDWEGI